MPRHTPGALTAAIATFAAAALLLSPTDASAQEVPDVLPYQGYLTSAAGEPVDDAAVALTFRIYETPDAQTPAWLETIEGVKVEQGVFYVYLGMQNPIWDRITGGGPLWLGIEVNGDGEAEPRQEIGSVPFAILAGNALALGGRDANEFLTRTEIIQLIDERLRNVAAQPYILGASDTESDGRVQYTDNNGVTSYGLRGANAMCRDSYPGVATAHLCTTGEVARAIAADSYDQNNQGNIDGVPTWTVGDVTDIHNGNHIQNTLGSTCQNFLYASGDASTGLRLTVDLDYTSIGNEGQVTSSVFHIRRDVNCAQSYRMMCCR